MKISLFVVRIVFGINEVFQPMTMLINGWSLVGIASAMILIQREIVEYIQN